MRTVLKKIYQFHELSTQAKQHAKNTFMATNGYVSESDALNSLKGFAKHFNTTLHYYTIDFENSHSYATFFINPDGN